MATSSSPSPGLSRAQVGGLVSLMLVAGISNSMLTKYQDMQCVRDCGTDKPKLYEQPVFQTLTMFVGETCCLVALAALRSKQRLSSRSRSKNGGKKAQYSRLPVDDSGVVLTNESAFTMRTVDNGGDSDLEDEDEDEEDDDRVGVQVHKPVVGQDEVVPGTEEPVEEKTEKLEGSRALLMWLPAIFDICGTTLMSVGLIYVPVSVYQMLRGALVLWVGLFSVLFLNRRLPFEQWASLGIVMGGVAVVGLSNSISGSGGASESQVDVGKAVIGAALVLFAQIFTASQFVIEEKIMTRYSLEPLKAVGLEGAFGLGTTMILMPILYFTLGHTSSGSGNGGFFDVPSGFHETFSNSTIWLTSLAICASIAFFNFSGLAVTKNVSATARSLIDTSRTVGIWAVSLLLGWEQLAGLQVLGFGMLVYGTLCFNEILPFPFRYFRSPKPTESSGSFETVESSPKRPGFSRGRDSSSDAQQIDIVRHDGAGAESVPDERSPLL